MVSFQYITPQAVIIGDLLVLSNVTISGNSPAWYAYYIITQVST